MSFKRQQSGFTLIEVLIGIVIVLGLWALIASIMSGASPRTAALEEVTKLRAIKQCIKDRKSGTDYATFQLTGLISSNCLEPYDVVNTAGTTLINTFGGTITPTAVSLLGINNNGIQLASTTNPSAECNMIVMDSRNDWTEILVNGTDIKTAAAPNVDENALATACDNAQNDISLRFM